MRAGTILAAAIIPISWCATALPSLAAGAMSPTAGVVTAPAPPGMPDFRIGDDNNYWEFYGQINKGILVFNDGANTNVFVPVDNADSSTRFGTRSLTTLDDEWTMGTNIEFEWNPYSTNNVNQLNIGTFDWTTALLRKGEIYFTSKDMGKFWIGQGSMASDSTAEVDFSGTTVVGYSLVSDMAGGPLFTFDTGVLSGVSVKSVFSNFDGASRKLRVRYDTPSFDGFTFGASAGTQVVPTVTGVPVVDVAARYDNTIDDFKFGAAAALSMPAVDTGVIDGSFSVLHQPTGLSLTAAAGYESTTATQGRYIYGKAGYQHDFFDFGTTAMSVDAYFGQDIGTAGSESRSLGGQLVQNIDDLQTELYLGARVYQYHEPTQNYRDGVAVLSGARWKF